MLIVNNNYKGGKLGSPPTTEVAGLRTEKNMTFYLISEMVSICAWSAGTLC